MHPRPWLSVALCLFGLITVGARAEPRSDAAACRALFTDLDALVDRAGVRDQGPYPVPDYPYLRINRFLASFRPDPGDNRRFSRWVAALAGLDRAARGFELENLPQSVLAGLGRDPESRIDRCRGLLAANDTKGPAARRHLLHVARVPDEYEGSWRLLGLYPISALFVSRGVDRWHEEARKQMNGPLRAGTREVRWWRSWPGRRP